MMDARYSNKRARPQRWQRVLAATVATVLVCTLLTAQPSSAATQDERFIARVFSGSPTSAELLWFSTILANGSTRSAVVADIVQLGGFNMLMGVGMYRLYLDRDPSSSELSSAVSTVSSGNYFGLETSLASGSEYFALAGSSNGGFVQKLFADVLRRPADPGGLTYWTGELNSASRTRLQVASAIIRSSESASLRVAGPTSATACSRTTLSAVNHLFVGAYCLILDRVADSSGKAYWSSQLQANGNNLKSLFVSLTSSFEYYSAS